MKLQILGTGCPNCRLLTDKTERAARELGLDYELEKIEEIDRILSFGVMMTPALAIDGEVKLAGSVPHLSRMKELLEASR